jgi:release factor glutamine methyltransferase
LGAQTVIEIGTGCGNIAVSLAKLCAENVTILASDISPEAVEIAYKNVRKFNVQGKISLFCGDLFRPFTDYEGKTDMVICNPPYIPTSFLKKLSPEIIDHEPVLALDGGPYGIDIFRKLMNGALTVLKRGGVLVFEIGAGQEKLIERLFEKNTSYNEILHFKYDEHVRVISAIRK